MLSRRTLILVVSSCLVLMAGGSSRPHDATIRGTPMAAAPTETVSDDRDRPPLSSVLAVDPATVTPPEVTTRGLAAQATGCVASPGVKNAAPGPGKSVALTFDDGPGASTGQILDILTEADATATFFNLGVNQTVRPDLVRSEFAEGFALGNHTWSHPDLTTLSAAGQAQEMDRCTAEQQLLVGQSSCIFRPPYGSYNQTTIDVANTREMTVWTWSVDTEDWKATSATSYWVDRIVSRATSIGTQQHPVVLLHNTPAGNPATVAALPRIIDYYRNHGFTFVDLGGHTRRPPDSDGDGIAARLRVGHIDFAGDGRSDVFRASGGTWYVSDNGTGLWRVLNTSVTPLSELAFADLNGDHRTDVVRTTGTQWQVSYSGTGHWAAINQSSARLDSLALG